MAVAVEVAKVEEGKEDQEEEGEGEEEEEGEDEKDKEKEKKETESKRFMRPVAWRMTNKNLENASFILAELLCLLLCPLVLIASSATGGHGNDHNRWCHYKRVGHS